ncbi:MAG TPA: FAD-dependent oxidoreductase [Thermoanaerobaculia bacterium]|nr:FAD-dependent oxidoreductase [Thermoanaerobaculia bacterium]HUM29746.1 FAD-dependent oxidoreductase [Thermoanaerobaculia bacterium]HXK67046.1 FAD-dependent oxidoreductase [Thermoanaerobaculia bacterium]
MTKHFPYIIVGGGMTADAAVSGIREIDSDREIALFTREPHPPYDRPPLSKSIWEWKKEDKIWREASRSEGVAIHTETDIRQLIPADHKVVDSAGNEYTYGKLLLATGGKPITLGPYDKRIIHFRTLDDYRTIKSFLPEIEHLTIVGGGFIGSEMAAALVDRVSTLQMFFPESGIGAKIMPEQTSHYLNDLFRKKGVDIQARTRVKALEPAGSTVKLTIETAGNSKEKTLETDLVVIGAGLSPNVDLAERAGLMTDDGIIADSALRAGHPSIFTAGDVAKFPCTGFEGLIRVEHEDNALQGGQHAGRAMAGEVRAYDHLPFFYSDLFHIGYEAVGQCDSTLSVIEDWTTPHEKGVLYYVDEERLRGVLLMDVWGKVDAARKMICSHKTVHPDQLPGTLST